MSTDDRHPAQDYFDAIPWPELLVPPLLTDIPTKAPDEDWMLAIWFQYETAPINLEVMISLLERIKTAVFQACELKDYRSLLLGFQVTRNGEIWKPKSDTEPIVVIIPSFRKRWLHNFKHGRTHPAVSPKQHEEMFTLEPGLVCDTICRVFCRPMDFDLLLEELKRSHGRSLLASRFGDGELFNTRWHTLNPKDIEID